MLLWRDIRCGSCLQSGAASYLPIFPLQLYTHSGHQSQKGRENIPITGTDHRRGERIYSCRLVGSRFRLGADEASERDRYVCVTFVSRLCHVLSRLRRWSASASNAPRRRRPQRTLSSLWSTLRCVGSLVRSSASHPARRWV